MGILHCSYGNRVFLGSSEAHKSLSSAFLNFSIPKNLLEDLLKYRFLGPISKLSDSGDLGQGVRICTSNKSSGDADMLVL